MRTAGGQRKRLVVAGFGMVAHKLVERLVALEALGEYAVTIIGEEPYAASNRVLMISFLAASVFGAGAAAVMGHRSARFDLLAPPLGRLDPARADRLSYLGDLMVVQHNQNANLRPNEKMIRQVCLTCHSLALSIDALADSELIRRNFCGASVTACPEHRHGIVTNAMTESSTRTQGGGLMRFLLSKWAINKKNAPKTEVAITGLDQVAKDPDEALLRPGDPRRRRILHRRVCGYRGLAGVRDLPQRPQGQSAQRLQVGEDHGGRRHPHPIGMILRTHFNLYRAGHQVPRSHQFHCREVGLVSPHVPRKKCQSLRLGVRADVEIR